MGGFKKMHICVPTVIEVVEDASASKHERQLMPSPS
jgi:hypothetical protein